MPTRPSSPCTTCHRLNCTVHVKRQPFAGVRRLSNLYSSSRWRKESRAFLIGKRCVDCGASTHLQTDHVPEHDGTELTFYDRARFVPRCRLCHARRTARSVNAKRYGKTAAA